MAVHECAALNQRDIEGQAGMHRESRDGDAHSSEPALPTGAGRSASMQAALTQATAGAVYVGNGIEHVCN